MDVKTSDNRAVSSFTRGSAAVYASQAVAVKCSHIPSSVERASVPPYLLESDCE